MQEPFYVRVGRVAQIFGVCTETIRKREAKGLIAPSVRKGRDRRYNLFSLPLSEEEKEYWLKIILEQTAKGKERAHSPEVNCINSLYISRKNNRVCVECGNNLLEEDFTINCKACREKRKVKSNFPKAKARAKEYNRDWTQRNRDKLNRRIKEREQIDLQYKLSRRIRTRLYGALKGRRKNSKTISLGCSPEELKSYLENLFLEGMSWENYGNKENCWSIDHIKPLNSFDLLNEEDFRKATHYTNLRPLWHIDNLKKGAKILEGEPRWE